MQSLLHRFFALIYFFSSQAIEANPECDEENVNYGKKIQQRSDEHEAFNTGKKEIEAMKHLTLHRIVSLYRCITSGAQL
jgi:hypothetical protein